jgi:hypothetical protein
VILLFVGQLLFYTSAVIGWQLERRARRIRLFNVIYFFVSSNVAALFGLWRWLRGTQKVTWQKRTSVTS